MTLRLIAMLVCLSVPFGADSFAQNLDYARSMVKALTSPEYWGRGYTRDGMKKASELIIQQISIPGVTPLDDKDFRQDFTMPINTFPGKMKFSLNGVELKPGTQFIIDGKSKGGKFEGTLKKLDSTHFTDATHSFTLILESKLTATARLKADEATIIRVDQAQFEGEPLTYSLEIENEFLPAFRASNIAAKVTGTKYPDQYLVISAHYDHLGGMGSDTYFPGANDNASGTAVLLDLVQYYAAHPAPYTMVFLFFAAEEAGLVGSKYFVEHPLIDLKKIRFVTNLDLMGNGDEGATVINATEFATDFGLLQQVNRQGNFLTQLKSRGKAPNSDHYWFSENGVPAFFIYTLGGPPYYHDVNDRAETLPYSRYNEVFGLITEFNRALSAQ